MSSIGDLKPLREVDGTLVLLAHELAKLTHDYNRDEPLTGAVVVVENGEYVEVWGTEFSAPYLLDAIYERIA